MAVTDTDFQHAFHQFEANSVISVNQQEIELIERS